MLETAPTRALMHSKSAPGRRSWPRPSRCKAGAMRGVASSRTAGRLRLASCQPLSQLRVRHRASLPLCRDLAPVRPGVCADDPAPGAHHARPRREPKHTTVIQTRSNSAADPRADGSGSSKLGLRSAESSTVGAMPSCGQCRTASTLPSRIARARPDELCVLAIEPGKPESLPRNRFAKKTQSRHRDHPMLRSGANQQ